MPTGVIFLPASLCVANEGDYIIEILMEVLFYES